MCYDCTFILKNIPEYIFFLHIFNTIIKLRLKNKIPFYKELLPPKMIWYISMIKPPLKES